MEEDDKKMYFQYIDTLINSLNVKQKELLIREKEAFYMIKEIIKVSKRNKNFDFTFMRNQMNLLMHTLENEKNELQKFKNHF